LPDLRAITREVRERANGLPTIRPSQTIPWGTVGEAIDYRIVFSFPAARALIPQCGMFAIEGMLIVDVGAGPIPRLPAELGAFALTGARLLQHNLVRDFFLGLREKLEVLSPMDHRLDGTEEEQLCRYCYGLGLFDEITRAGLGIRSPLYELRRGASVNDLLAIASEASIGDVCRMASAFCDGQQDLFAGNAVLKPTFSGSHDVGGADADLIVDGCLIEVKTAIDPGKISKRSWPWQLLGYALLDYENTYRIDSVGLYLARQALLLRWPLGEFASKLAGQRAEIEEMRSAFRKCLRGSSLGS
jgi:hypothetical protein